MLSLTRATATARKLRPTTRKAGRYDVEITQLGDPSDIRHEKGRFDNGGLKGQPDGTADHRDGG